MWLPLPGGASVPLDSMGQPDFSRVLSFPAGGPVSTPGAQSPVGAPADVPVFRSSTTAIDPKWLIFGLLAIALFLAHDR